MTSLHHGQMGYRLGLNVVYGVDICRKLDAVTITCYGSTEVWDSRKEGCRLLPSCHCRVRGQRV